MTPSRKPGIPAPVLVWAVIAAIVWIVAATAAIFLYPRPADAGTTRLVTIGANIRGDDRGRPVIQRDARHTSTGIVRPRCEGPYLRFEPRPTSRYAPFLSVTVDGWLLRHGYAAGLASVQGRRVLVAFTRHGEPATCAEVMGHPEGNTWVTGTVVR